MKNKYRLLYFVILVLSVLLSAAALYCYKPITERAEAVREKNLETEKAAFEEWKKTPWVPAEDTIRTMFQSNYLFYAEFCQNQNNSFMSMEDVLIAEVSEELQSYGFEEVREEIRNSIEEMLSTWWNERMYLEEEYCYYAVDHVTGNIRSNTSEEQNEWIRSVLSGQADLEQNSKEDWFQGWYWLSYDENGIVHLGGFQNVVEDELRWQLSNISSKNLYEPYSRSGATSLTLESPKDMEVFYAQRQRDPFEWEYLDTVWASRYTYASNGGDLLFVSISILAVVSGIVLGILGNKKGLLSKGLLALPMEFSIFGIGLIAVLYENLSTTLTQTGMGDLKLQFMNENFLEWSAELLVWLYNGFLWAALVIVVIWGILVLWPREKGMLAYLKERSLCWKLCGYVKKQCKRFYAYAMHIDITESANKTILRLVLINLAILIVFCCMWFFGIAALILYSILLYLFLREKYGKVQEQYDTLLMATAQMAEGNLNVEMPENLGVMEPLKEQVVRLQDGFKQAVAEEVKSQRMKTELITNVSHDLKTPLTAIITYVDLLKNESITPEERASYIETLEKKSDRLRGLIEDLFEVSKAESDNITLNLEDVDLVNLIKQVRLELEDKITASTLNFRWNLPEEKVVCQLDGQRTFRVFENLIGNILKYSMEGSRVYIDLKQLDDHVQVTLKNISATELNFDPEEITERFVRGDLSRNTEGSGLGLAIARSFVELQGGTFRVEIDGDLFKVQIVW